MRSLSPTCRRCYGDAGTVDRALRTQLLRGGSAKIVSTPVRLCVRTRLRLPRSLMVRLVAVHALGLHQLQLLRAHRIIIIKRNILHLCIFDRKLPFLQRVFFVLRQVRKMYDLDIWTLLLKQEHVLQTQLSAVRHSTCGAAADPGLLGLLGLVAVVESLVCILQLLISHVLFCQGVES